MTTPNAELAYKVLDHIDADPEGFHQGVWIAKATCGTVACFAGWTCVLSGDEPDFDEDDEFEASEVWTGPSGLFARVPDRAARLLGIEPDGGPEGVGGYRIFSAKNTREDLGRLVAEIFGPRPAVTA
jgi:hypothetical protein